MKNSQLFETLLTPVWPIWAWPLYLIWAKPLGGWPEKALKYVKNTHPYTLYCPFATEAGVFFSCFTVFSEPTQLHSAIEFRP